MSTATLFYLLSTIIIFSALRVITAKNPVHAVLFLVLAFVTAACLWLTLDVEFLALILVVVYVGAVVVLFLFVVMMLDIDVEALRKGFWKNLPLALVLGVVVLVEIVLVLASHPLSVSGQFADINPSSSNARQLGIMLYTQYAYPVELASMLLLLGLVAAVALTLRKTDKNAKYQNIARQVGVNASDRVTLVEMKVDLDDNNDVSSTTTRIDSSST